MEYVAIHYVKIAGRMYTPGEIFSAELTASKEQRLITKGAIRVMPGETKLPAPRDVPATEGGGEIPDVAEESEEGEDDEGAPEIDVMDGIVDDMPPEDEQPKPKAKRRKSTSRKPAAEGGKP